MMHDGVQKERVTRRGAAACELAVLLPFLAFLLALTLDFCRVYQATVTVQNCADAAALHASGACDAPAYRPGQDLLSGVGDIVDGLLGWDWPTGASPSEIQAEREKRGRDAAVAEGAGLKPALKAEQVSMQKQGTTITVRVEHEVSLLLPVLSSSRKVTVSRTVTMTRLP
jgi:hypothetical protein